MQADMELYQIMEQGQDFFSSEAVVEVDMGDTTHQTKNKNQLDIMSTSLILTFWSTAMMVTKPKIQCKQCNTNKNQAQQNLDQVSMMTGTTLLEKDIDTLLNCLLNAMQQKN